MRDEQVEIPMADGRTYAFFRAPEGDGPWPAVLYFPHGPGIDDGFHIMSKRLAGDGYAVLMPHIYYRTTSGPAFPGGFDFKNPKTRERFMELTGPLTPDAMERDTISYIDWLAQHATGAVGVAGYCFTGKMALRAAAAAGKRIAAAASFHGGGLITGAPDSPHLVLPRVTARLYFGHATNDPGISADDILRLEAALRAWGGHFESETYPAAHGWTVPGWPIFDEAQAERHYRKLTELFAQTLAPQQRS